MSAERILEEAREQVRKIVPSTINITSIDFEGPVVVVYTQDMEAFASNNDIVRQLAQGLRKRVAIRPDPSTLADPDTVEKRIREIIPEDAQITDIYFEPETGEVDAILTVRLAHGLTAASASTTNSPIAAWSCFACSSVKVIR